MTPASTLRLRGGKKEKPAGEEEEVEVVLVDPRAPDLPIPEYPRPQDPNQYEPGKMFACLEF